jgi:hypothetical protein
VKFYKRPFHIINDTSIRTDCQSDAAVPFYCITIQSRFVSMKMPARLPEGKAPHHGEDSDDDDMSQIMPEALARSKNWQKEFVQKLSPRSHSQQQRRPKGVARCDGTTNNNAILVAARRTFCLAFCRSQTREGCCQSNILLRRGESPPERTFWPKIRLVSWIRKKTLVPEFRRYNYRAAFFLLAPGIKSWILKRVNNLVARKRSVLDLG